jgi:hypothetical protein
LFRELVCLLSIVFLLWFTSYCWHLG